jgi:hypothetical protein
MYPNLLTKITTTIAATNYAKGPSSSYIKASSLGIFVAIARKTMMPTAMGQANTEKYLRMVICEKLLVRGCQGSTKGHGVAAYFNYLPHS